MNDGWIKGGLVSIKILGIGEKNKEGNKAFGWNNEWES
jgi:hypothetical protein